MRPETFDCVFQVSANLRRPFYSSQCEFVSALTPLIAVLLRNLKKVRGATNSPRGENELAQYLPNRISCPAAHQEKISSFPHTPPTQFFSFFLEEGCVSCTIYARCVNETTLVFPIDFVSWTSVELG